MRTGAISTEDFDRRSKAAVEAQASARRRTSPARPARLDLEFTEVRTG